MEKITACFITNFTIEQRLYRQLSSLNKIGYNISLIGYYDKFDPPNIETWKLFKLKLILLSRKRNIGFVFFIKFMIKAFFVALRQKSDIYFAADLPALIPLSFAAFIKKKRLVYDSREIYTELPDVYNFFIKKFFWKFFEQICIKKAESVISVCNSDKEVLEKMYGHKKLYVIKNLPLFKEHNESDLIREKLNLKNDRRKIFLYQGSLLKHGGIYETAEAFGRIDDALLVIIGDGPEEIRIKELVKTKKLKGKVFFLGLVPFNELHKYTCSADIGVFAAQPCGKNLENALPNKIFEYAMAGLPTMTTYIYEIVEIDKKYRFAFFFDSRDQNNIIKSINYIIKNPNQINRLRTNALKMAKEMCWEHEEMKFTKLFGT